MRRGLCSSHAAGYKPAGDVVALGLEPPTNPIACFRDDVGLRLRGSNVGAGGSGGEEAAGVEPPPTMRPKEFSLIWRYNGRRPVTVWMPVSPPGYVALGAVVLGSPDVPSPHEVLCLRCSGRPARGLHCMLGVRPDVRLAGARRR